VEAVVMERIADESPYLQLLRECFQEVRRKGFRGGQLEGLRDVLLRLLARAGIPLIEEERARILACTDVETLQQWTENVLGAKTAADVLTWPGGAKPFERLHLEPLPSRTRTHPGAAHRRESMRGMQPTLRGRR